MALTILSSLEKKQHSKPQIILKLIFEYSIQQRKMMRHIKINEPNQEEQQKTERDTLGIQVLELSNSDKETIILTIFVAI